MQNRLVLGRDQFDQAEIIEEISVDVHHALELMMIGWQR